MDDIYPPPLSAPSGNPRQWTSGQVEVWFRVHKNGKWSAFAPNFASLTGDELCDLTEEQLMRFVDDDPRGAIVFNEVVKLHSRPSVEAPAAPVWQQLPSMEPPPGVCQAFLHVLACCQTCEQETPLLSYIHFLAGATACVSL
jgi:hypothetical protein